MKQITSLLLITALCFQGVKSSAFETSPVPAHFSPVHPFEAEALSGVGGWYPQSYTRFGGWLKRLTNFQRNSEIQVKRSEWVQEVGDPEIRNLELALGHTFSQKSRDLLKGLFDPRHPFVHTEEMRRRVWHGIVIYEVSVMDQLFRMNPVSRMIYFDPFRKFILSQKQRKNFFKLWADSASYSIPRKFRNKRFSLLLLSLLAEEKAEDTLDRITLPLLQSTLQLYPKVLEPYNQLDNGNSIYFQRYAAQQISLWAAPYVNHNSNLETYQQAMTVSGKEEILLDRRFSYWGDRVLARFWADQLIANTDSTVSATVLAKMSDQINSNETFCLLSDQIIRQGILPIVYEQGGAFLETTAILIYLSGNGGYKNGYTNLTKALAAVIRPELRRLRKTVGKPAHAFLEHWVALIDPRPARIQPETRRLLKSLYTMQQDAIKYGVVGNEDWTKGIVEDILHSLNTTVPSLPEVWRIRVEPGLVATLAVTAALWGKSIFELILPESKPESIPEPWVHEFLNQLLDYYRHVDVLGEWLVERENNHPGWMGSPFGVSLVKHMSNFSVHSLTLFLMHSSSPAFPEAIAYERILVALMKFHSTGPHIVMGLSHDYDHLEWTSTLQAAS